MKYVATFPSEYFVIKAESRLKKQNYSVRLIPTPRKISSDCGMALEIDGDYDSVEELKKLLEELGLRELDGVFGI